MKIIEVINRFSKPLEEQTENQTNVIKKYLTYRQKSLRITILNTNVISSEDRIFRFASLKSEKSETNPLKRTIIVNVHYCPIAKQTPILLIEAKIRTKEEGVVSETKSNEGKVANDPFEVLKAVLFLTLKDRELFLWSALEDCRNLHINAEELTEFKIKGKDLSNLKPFKHPTDPTNGMPLMIALWAYCVERIKDIDNSSQSMSFGYDCRAESRAILSIGLKLQRILEEYQRSGGTVNGFLDYNKALEIWFKSVSKGIIGLNKSRLVGRTSEEINLLNNNWISYQIIAKKKFG